MGSFLDALLVAAAGQLRTVGPFTGGQSALAVPGVMVLCDPTTGVVSVSAPPGAAVGTYFGVADVTGQSAVHAIHVLSSGGSYQLESPASPATYSNDVTIASASRVRVWLYSGPSPGWKLICGVF